MKRVEVYCDGAARGNPGPGAYGYVIYENSRIVAQEGKTLGDVTNNVAEYQGLIHGLEGCSTMAADEVVIRTDSELLVKQLKGEYRVKAPHLKPLHAKALQLMKAFSRVEVLHIRRELNQVADELCNRALDGTLV